MTITREILDERKNSMDSKFTLMAADALKLARKTARSLKLN